MTVPVPLGVRLKTGTRDIHVGHEIKDLQFASKIPGGFSTCTLSLNRPLKLAPGEIGYFGSLYVYDARNGVVVWEGRVEDLGRSAGSDGEVYELGAVGPSAHAKDRTIPLGYISSEPQDFIKFTGVNGIKQGQVDVTDDDGLSPGVYLRMPLSATITNGKGVFACFKRFSYNGQRIARVSVSHDAWITTAAWNFGVSVQQEGGAGFTLAASASLSSVSGTFTIVIGTNWTASGQTECLLEHWLANASPTGTGSDPNTVWVCFRDLAVQATRYDRNGNELLTAGSYTANTILASQVVEDLLGRLLPRYDPNTSSVSVTAYGIDQLMWSEGVTADHVLEELMTLEPGYYWAAWESDDQSGKYRFEWSAWPTTVRYEADVTDGCSFPSSADEIYNEALVRYKGGHGFDRTAVSTQSVDALTLAGLTRTVWQDQGANIGTVAAAQRAGSQYLADHVNPPNAGTLTISRPILDLQSGRMVQPWEIRPGALIRVRGVQPRIDALNPTNRDGVSIFRITSVEFRAGDASATLELDAYSKATARAIAKNELNRITRRR